MTPYTQHHNDSYLAAYTAELRVDLTAAHATEGVLRRIRRSLARSLVRIGARMLPETPDIVDGRIIVMSVPHDDSDVPKAA